MNDRLGHTIYTGDYIAYAVSKNGLRIGKVLDTKKFKVRMFHREGDTLRSHIVNLISFDNAVRVENVEKILR
jgi:hypothetical protein